MQTHPDTIIEQPGKPARFAGADVPDSFRIVARASAQPHPLEQVGLTWYVERGVMVGVPEGMSIEDALALISRR